MRPTCRPSTCPACDRRSFAACWPGSTPDVDVVLPEAHGFRHPLAAAYRTALATPLGRDRRGGAVQAGRAVRRRAHARGRARLAAGRPGCCGRRIRASTSLLNVNDPDAYAAAHSVAFPRMSDHAALDAAHAHARAFLDTVRDRPAGPSATTAEVADALGGPLPQGGTDPVEVIEHLARAAEPGLVELARTALLRLGDGRLGRGGAGGRHAGGRVGPDRRACRSCRRPPPQPRRWPAPG